MLNNFHQNDNSRNCFSNPLALNFPSIVWKPLVGEALNADDLRNIDVMCVNSLETLRTIDKQGVTSETFEDVIYEVFAIQSIDGREFDLKPNGKETPVTFENRNEWIDLVENFRLNEFNLQVNTIRQGISSVVPIELLALFTWKELEVLVTGRPTLDLELLKKCTSYSGYSPNDEIVKNFWKVLASLSKEEQILFLRFTSGRSRLPLTAADFPRFQLEKFSTLNPDDHLPASHTCFFTLDLPKYSSYEIMRERIIYAITQCQAIDTDFNAHNAEMWAL